MSAHLGTFGLCTSNVVTPRPTKAPMRASNSARPRARSRIPMARWCSGSTTCRCRPPGRQVAADILAQKYFRKAGVAKHAEEGRGERRPLLAVALRRRREGAGQAARGRALRLGDRRPAGLRPARRHLDLLGLEGRLFRHRGGRAAPSATSSPTCWPPRSVAPNSPQWFNTGLHWAYGIDGPGQGHFYVDPFTGKLTKSKSAYEHPQPHACFIQSVQDDLVNEGGIMDLWVREARLFKYGSGTGSNFSQAARRRRKAVGRRPLVRPDELPQDRRPRGGRHQVGRHDAPRRQDGGRRHRSSRYRDLHQLEGEGGAEGRRARHRLQDRPASTSRPS